MPFRPMRIGHLGIPANRDELGGITQRRLQTTRKTTTKYPPGFNICQARELQFRYENRMRAEAGSVGAGVNRRREWIFD